MFRKWKEEKAALLEEMDEKEREDQEEWIAQGKKELEEWYARLNEQLGKTKENNRFVLLKRSLMTENIIVCWSWFIKMMKGLFWVITWGFNSNWKKLTREQVSKE